MRSTWSFERPLEASMRIFCSRPVPLSRAETFTMPLASMSNVTSICGTPRGAGGIPSRIKLPSERLSLANSRSPCNTLISTLGWLSLAVEKTWLFCVGIVVLRSIRRVETPPRVDTQREWSDVEQEYIFNITSQDSCLDSCANCHHFVWVHSTMWIA